MLAFKSVCVSLRESGCLRECAKFDWQAKGRIGNSGCKQNCPLTKESVSGKLTVPTRFQLMAIGVIIGRSSPRSGNLLFTFIVDCYFAITLKLNFCKQLLLNLNITC